jgi:2,3-bisphosphoglycerate-dependent phosphoglycerate mutase
VSDLTVHFVRHGESLANAADHTGEPRPADWDRLSERGWEQARELGRRLEGHDLELIVASTMTRARETAEAIAEVLDLPIEIDPDLHEYKQSDAFYDTMPPEAELGMLGWMPRSPRDHAEPGAESFDEAVARVRRAQEKLEERAGRRFVVVSHFNFLHFFLGEVLFGDVFGPEHLLPLHQAGHANTGISIFERRSRRLDGFDLSGWSLTTWNDQAHL